MSFSLRNMEQEVGSGPTSPPIRLRVTALEDPVRDYGIPTTGKRGIVGVAAGKRFAFLSRSPRLGQVVDVPESLALEVPECVSDEVACSLVSAGVAAQFVTRTLMPVWSGATILVASVPSRITEFAIVMARLKGAHLYGEALNGEEALFLQDTRTPEITLGPEAFDIAYVARSAASPIESLGQVKTTGCIVDFLAVNRPKIARGTFIMRPPLPDIVANEYEFLERAATVFRMYLEGQLPLL